MPVPRPAGDQVGREGGLVVVLAAERAGSPAGPQRDGLGSVGGRLGRQKGNQQRRQEENAGHAIYGITIVVSGARVVS